LNPTLPFSPAAERNRGVIADSLSALFSASTRDVLEIGSGTGEHAEHFLGRYPRIRWQCTELGDRVDSLKARVQRIDQQRAPLPLVLDVRQADWPPGPYDAVFTANTLHIMPWGNAVVLLDRVVEVLRPDGQLIIYGPFHDNGVHTAPSNLAFDQSLKSRDPAMGVRDAVELTAEAAARGFLAEADLPLPANNRILVFRKVASASA